MKVEEIIKALRCSASVLKKGHSCEGCPYKFEEAVGGRYRSLADFERDGVLYCIGCDCDKIALDAADMLERAYKAWNESSVDEGSKALMEVFGDGE